jgi:outer membrane immunogenic protein
VLEIRHLKQDYTENRMKSSVLLVAAAIVLPALQASAADLPQRARAPVFAAPAATWTGFYLGVSGGWAQSSFKDKDAVQGDTERANGGLIGITAGYNQQLSNNIVIGLEGDYSFGMIEKKQNYSDVFPGIGRFEETSKITTDGFGTVRGRVGYAFGSFMPYLTAGIAIANNKFELTDQFIPLAGPAGPITTTTSSKTVVGWTAGIGGEYLLTQNWTVKGEYLYANFGTKRYTFTSSNGFTGDARINQEMHIVRAGVNYKF